jgi:beta-N-acetylhexosaminidase
MTYDDFQSGQGYPFVQAVKNRLPGIMVGHISTPNLSSLDLPASLNPDLIENYLRKQLYYDELVITDSLQMKAITSQYDSGQAAILAIQAGCDIILMPEDFKEAYDALLMAVKNEIISEDRIDQSLERIYRYKRLLQ